MIINQDLSKRFLSKFNEHIKTHIISLEQEALYILNATSRLFLEEICKGFKLQ